MRRVATGLVWLLASWTVAFPSGLREQALVRRIQWPVTIEAREPGGCDDLTPEDVIVEEDGLRLKVDLIEKRRLRAVHAIVVDNSGSMTGRLDAAKRAARAYLERLPADEAVAVATFSDNLILNTPLTTDHAVLTQAIERIEPRAYTALNDAIHFTTNYLSSRPERKILILLTDGCDSTSLTSHSLHEVVQTASEIPNLAVFPIGIDLPARCGGGLVTSGYDGGPLVPLQKLAEKTGGQLYLSRDSSNLPQVFDEILDRIDSEGYVSYQPPAHGAGRKDREGVVRHRRVRVTSPRKSRCRIASAGPPTRAEYPPASAAEGREPAADGPITLHYRDWWSDNSEKDDGEPLGRLTLQTDAMLGHGLDLARERSILYSSTRPNVANRYVPVEGQKVQIARRDYHVDVPSFDLVLNTLTSPESVLLYLLDRDEAPFGPFPEPDGRRELARFLIGDAWIHGQTMLEIRETLGQGLFHYPGYRELALRRAQDAYRVAMEHVFAHSIEVRALSVEDRRRLEEVVASQRPEPNPTQLAQFLGNWLGDISAHDLVAGFERWAVESVLDGNQATAGVVEAIENKWDRLARWFPPPTKIRIVTPLVPSYDADRDVVGFWRILLPVVVAGRPPPDRVPPHPLGLTFARRLTGSRIRVPVNRVSYLWDDTRQRRRVVRGAIKSGWIDANVRWKDVPMVSLSFGPDGDDALECKILWAPPGEVPPEPACVDLTYPTPPWAEELRTRILEIAPECVVDPGA